MEKISDFIISILPSSPVTFLIYLGVIVVLSVLLIFIFSRQKSSKSNENTPKTITLEDLLKIAKNKKSTKQDLAFAMEYFYNNFEIKDNEKKSFELLEKLLHHKNRTKLLFDIFHGKILPKNLSYKDKLNELEKEALNK